LNILGKAPFADLKSKSNIVLEDRPMAKVMISIPDNVLKKVDRAAKTQRRSRTEVISAALRAQMGKPRKGASKWKNALAPLRMLEQHWVGQWDSTDIIRYYRDNRYGREDRR
jgi:metal-responsive CopG/Arc/MetJ family transcriptional regulator